MRGRAANRVHGTAIYQQIEIGARTIVRRVAWGADFLTLVPPAVLAADHVQLQRAVQLRPRPNTADRRGYPHPVTGAYPARGGQVRMQLDLRVHRTAPQTWDIAVLRFAKMRVLGTGQHQRKRFRPES